MSGDEGEDKDAVQSLLLARGLPTLDRQELYFLLLHFLSGGPCQRTFQILKEEAVEHGLLPSRSDVFGGKHTLTYEQLKGLHTDIDGGFLEDLVSSFVHLRDCHSGHESGGGQKGSSRGREVALPKAVFRQSLLAPSLLRTDIRIKSVRSVARNTVLTGVLARETGEGRIQPHQAATAKLLGHKFRHQRTLRGHRLVVYCLTYDRSGEMLVTGSDDYLVKIWSTVTGHVLASCRGHNGEVTEVSVSCDNKYLASGCVDKTIRVWSLGAGSLGHPVSLLTGHTSVVTDLHFSPKVPSLLLSSSEDGSCRLWNILAPAMPPRILRPNARFALLTATRAAWATQARGGGEEQLGGSPGVGASASPGEQGTAAAPAGTEVVATPAAAVSPEDAQGRRDASSSEAQTGGVAAPAAASAADAAAASGRDAGAQLLAPQMPEAGTAAPGDSSPVMCCQFSPCGEFIVAGSLALGNCAYMWSWDAARFEAERLAAGVEAEAVWDDITLWPPVTEHCRLPVPGSEISFVVFSPQGYFLATAAKTGPIRLFRRGQPGGTPGQSPLKDWVEWNALASTLDVEFVQEVRRKRKGLPDAYVTGLCWTCDERHLVSAVVDRVVRVWDSHTGKLVHLLRGHTDMIHVLCCHPSNARLAASAAYDGHFKLWDIFSGTLLRHINTQHTFPGRGQWACPLALCVGSFSPDGSQIAIADAAGQFHMVGMGAQAPMARAMYDQFFTADYDELVFDRNLEVVDAATQQPPHLRLSPLADYCLHAYDEPYQSAFRTHRVLAAIRPPRWDAPLPAGLVSQPPVVGQASWRAMTAGHSIGQQQSAMATAMEDQRLLNEVYAGDNSPWPQELEKQLEGLPSWVPLERYEQASRPGQAASMQAGGGSGSGRRGQLTQVRVQWEEEGDLGVTISSSEDGDEAGRDAAYVANEGEEEEEDDDSDDHGDRERSMFPDAFLDDVRECDVEDSEEYAEALSASSDDEARAAPSGAGPPGRNSRGERLRRRHARRQNGAGPSNGEAGGRIHGSGRDRRRSRRQVRSRRGGEEHEQERERLRRLREAYPSQFPDWTDSDEEPNDLAAYLSEEEEEDAQAAEGDEEVPGASCRPASAKRRRDNRSARSDSLYSWLQVHSHRPGVYSAQVGDDVVFLRQGYLLFLQQANALRAEQLPWEQVFDTAHAASGGASGDAAAGPAAGEAAAAAAFRPAEACHVNDIQYKIMEDAEGNRYTVPVMELQLVCDSGPMRGRCFNLPLPPPALGHAEFIVLRRRFESGAGARLRIGDMVKNYYLENDEGAEAGSWYCGEIIGDKLNGSPCSDMYACQNLWERFQVRWMPRAAVSGGDEDDAGEDDESGKEEWLSPWELYADAATEEEAYRELRAPEDAAGAFQHALAAVTEVLQDSRFSALHQPPHARAVYRSIRQDRAVPYNSIVPLPFAFSIVHERLVHLYYRSQASLRHDLDTIVQNSELFNGADDGLTQQARQACDYVVALMEKQPGASLGGDGTERRQNGLRESSTSPPHRRGSGDGDDAQGQGKRKRWESEAGPSRRPVPEELAEGPHPAGEGARTSLADANGSPDATPPSRMRKRVRTISLNGMLRGSTPPGRSSSTVIRIRGPSSAPPAPQPSASQPRQRRRPSRQCWRDDDGAEEAADGVDDEEYVEEAEEEEEDEIEDDDVDDDDDLRPASRRRPRAGASSSRRRNQQLSGPSIQPSDGGGRSSARRSGRSRASAPPADHAGRQSLRSRRQPIQRSNDFVDSSLLDMELASDAELSDGPAAPARRRSRARRRRHSPDVSD